MAEEVLHTTSENSIPAGSPTDPQTAVNQPSDLHAQPVEEQPVAQLAGSNDESAGTPPQADSTTPLEETPPQMDHTETNSAPSDVPTTPESVGTPEPSTESVSASPEHDAPAEGTADSQGKKASRKKATPRRKKKAGPDLKAILHRIGKTPESAIEYLSNPEPAWRQLPQRFLDESLHELPKVTQGGLLGPSALCRHFIASAAAGRYRDLFYVWEVFKLFPDECKPVLMARPQAQELARSKMGAAVHYGLLGHADHIAEDIDRASGLPWTWLKEILADFGNGIAQRPAVIAALWRKDPTWPIELPANPDARWLREAAALGERGGEIPDRIKAVLAANITALPITVATLQLAKQLNPDLLPGLLAHISFDAPDIMAMIRWSRDNDLFAPILASMQTRINELAQTDREATIAQWKDWNEYGVDLPQSIIDQGLEGLDISNRSTALLAKKLQALGHPIDAQAMVEASAEANRQLGEKAYEAFVVAGFDEITLPVVLAENAIIKPSARCPKCSAWTWVRQGHEAKCPRPEVSFESEPQAAS